MGRLSRAESCPDNVINVVHCINRCVRRASNKGFLSMTLAEYVQLLDWTGRQLRRDGKAGVIPSDLRPVLDRIEDSE
ncbi:MAG: hypothetical protein ABGZ53_11930 [Fuerstiella sp.]|jgi:hypothetical protein